MALATRLNATNATAFSLDGISLLADLIDCEITINNATEDSKGATDRWAYPWATGSDWQATGNFFADSAQGTTLAQYGTATTPRFALAFSDGADSYTGTVVLTSVVKQYARDTLTKYSFTGQGYGTITVAA